MNDPVQLIEATKVYDGAVRPALDAVSLEIPKGRLTVIMGPSGAGNRRSRTWSRVSIDRRAAASWWMAKKSAG
jgi:ABC-type ATPase involved in cell division